MKIILNDKYTIQLKNENYNIFLLKLEDGSNIIYRNTSNVKERISHYNMFDFYVFYDVHENISIEIMKFKNNTNDNIGIIKNIFNFIIELFVDKEAKSLSETISKIKNIFGRLIGYTIDEIIGYFGEILFVRECLNKNIDISKYFNKKEIMLFDFYLPNNKYLEIKTTASENHSAIFNFKQLYTKKESTFYGIVKIELNNNGLNLFNLIKDTLDKFKTALDPDYLFKLDELSEDVKADILAEEIKIDVENVLISIHTPEIIQKELKIFNVLSDDKNWSRVENIKLKINLAGIKTEEIELVRELL